MFFSSVNPVILTLASVMDEIVIMPSFLTAIFLVLQEYLTKSNSSSDCSGAAGTFWFETTFSFLGSGSTGVGGSG